MKRDAEAIWKELMDSKSTDVQKLGYAMDRMNIIDQECIKIFNFKEWNGLNGNHKI